LLSLIFEFECGFNAASLVQKASTLVDLPHVADIEANEVQSQVEDEVGKQLFQKNGFIIDFLKKMKNKFFILLNPFSNIISENVRSMEDMSI